MNGLREKLRRDGFALVPGVVGDGFVASTRTAIGELLGGPSHPDLLRDHAGQVRKIAYPLALDPRFVIALAEPALIALASEISPAPDELVLTWEDVLYKAPLVGEAVPVHQDLAMQSLPGPVYSLGVHLEEATDNPVWFLPGSHRLGPQTKDQVTALRRGCGFVPLAPRAGDVLVHDALCVHYSDANTGAGARTTWYLEFRTLTQLRADGRWPDSWARSRRAILFHACAAREAMGLMVRWPDLGPGESLEGWLSGEAEFRVTHVSQGVDYDLTSPWYHFS
ncbi:MAG: phytanoyl-CoA dioxygenase family protein [Myxococcota bacterium]